MTRTGNTVPDQLDKQKEEPKRQQIQKRLNEQPTEQNWHANLSNKITTSSKTDPLSQANSLILTTSDNKKIELSSTRLEQWFSIIESKNANAHTSTPLSTQLLGRFGLRSAIEVIAFLKSPAGTEVKAMVNERLAEIAQMKEEQLFQYNEKIRRKHRALAFFLLGMLYKKEAKAKQRNELIQEQNEKILKANKASAKQPPSSLTETVSFTYEVHIALSESVKALQDEMTLMQKEREMLEKELVLIHLQEKEINDRYAAFSEHLDALDDFLITLSNDNGTESANESVKEVQNRLVQLQEKIDSHTEIISNLLEVGKDEDARLLLREINCLHLEGAALNDALSQLQNEKAFYDEQGQATQSLHKAAFAVSFGQKLVVDDDKYYLLSNTQDFTLMKENPGQLAAANLAFERAKPNIVNVKTLVTSNKLLENEALTQKAEKAIQRRDTILSHIDRCQEKQAQIKEHIHQIGASPTPAPRPEPKPQREEKPAEKFSKAFSLIQPKPTPQALANIFEMLKKSNQGGDPALFSEISKQFAAIKIGAPIPQQQINRLLANIEHLTLSTSEQNVSTATSKTSNPLPRPTPFPIKPPGSY